MKLKILFFLALLSFTAFAQEAENEISINRIEPPFWWAGMVNTELQLLVYGNDITNLEPSINYEGIEITNIMPAENPNYLFISLSLSGNLKPGKFNIDFKNQGEILLSRPYEIKSRKEGSASRKGFDRSDAIYLLMPDRFANGNPANDSNPAMTEKANRSDPNGRHGGDIQGISNHLDYIHDLGFTAVWINPLVENNNPEYSYHGYAITDFYKIDPRYGSNKAYVDLVNKAHQQDLKVIMDVVFNHCSIYHWFIQDLPSSDWIHQFDEYTRSNFRASTIMDPHASEYDLNKMLTGWFDKHMADLDQRNPMLAKYLIQNTIWWIEYAGIDGIRVDTQPYSYKEFISEWAREVFTEYPGFSIVGEAWLQEPAFTAYFEADAKNRDGYNSHIPSVTDFPMQGALNKAFVEKDSWTEGLARLYYVQAKDYLYASPDYNLIFLDNHDLTRFYSSINEDSAAWKMGMAALLTLRGIPQVYYGTELLMTGKEHDGHGFIRQDFPGGWTGDERNAFTKEGRTKAENEAFNYIQKLLNWRKSHISIFEGKTKQFIPDGNTYVYFRYNDKSSVMVAFNNSKNELKALDAGRIKECLKDYKFAVNVITGETVHYLDAFTLPPKSVLILELRK